MMFPVGHDDITYNANGVCDYRPWVNSNMCNTMTGDRNGQWNINYSDNDLQDDLNGLELAMNDDGRHSELKEIQAYKDLLDHVAFLISLGEVTGFTHWMRNIPNLRVSIGEMTDEDLRDTQNTVHEALKDTHNRYYQWFDLNSSLIQTMNTEFVNRLSQDLRKTHRVWYVCHSEDRVVMMGDNHNALIDCMDDLCDKLRVSAAGGWIDYGTDYAYGTTQRYERFNDRMDTQFANIHLIAKTWGVTVDEAFTRLTNETDQEYEQENALRLFALR
jgi:hypothetical protein